MSDKSLIEWTDATWNPITGCTKVSPGCDHCYAETFAERWRGTPGHHFEVGFDLTLRPDRLSQPLRWRSKRRVFVNSMSDLFHEGVDDDFIARVFAVMSAGHHTYQVLTKRHGRMRSLLSSPEFQALVTQNRNTPYWKIPGEMTWPLPNVWLGVSVEDQKWANIRIPALLETPAAVRWLSCEPLLGPIDLYETAVGPLQRFPDEPNDETGRIDWIVVGGESGPGARPMHPDWARSLRDQCQDAKVPFFFKQWGEYQPAASSSYLGLQDPLHGRGSGCVVEPDGRESAGWEMGGRSGFDGPVTTAGWPMLRVGKKRAGRELDGQTWDQYPAVAR